MGTRVGIELSPAACRVIEVEGGTPWGRRTPETRVQSFAVLPPEGPETQAKFETLRRQSAAVVVWGVPSDHRQVIVANRSYEAMRKEALAALANAGIETRGVLADIAPVTEGKERAPRRPVVVALAAAAPINAALAPLVTAGVRVRIVMTPASALASLARTRRQFAVPGAIEAYVALDETGTCIALVRDGALITARERSWGYIDDVGHAPRLLEDITVRLADELSEFFGAIGASPSAVSQICVCGGLPELRSMTARLTARLDIEVEPLDSLYGIDPEPLYEHVEDFRERCAELRLAWAAASEWPSSINLLRARRRQTTKTALSRAAIVAGTAAGLGVGWQVQRTAWWRSTTFSASTKTASSAKPSASPAKPTAATGRAATPAAPAAKPPTPSTTVAPPFATAPVVPSPPAPKTAAPATGPDAPVTPPPASVTKAPVPTAPAPVAKAPVPVAAPPPAIAKAPPPAPVTNAPPAAATKTPPIVAPPPPAVAKAPPPAVPTPPVAKVPAPTARPPAAVTPPPATAPSAARREPERPAAPRVETRPAPTGTPPPEPTRTAPPATVPAAPPATSAAPPRVEPTAPPVRQGETPPQPAPRRQPPARTPTESPLPFDASLGTILYSPDRKLAIIDGRIVGVGDEVRGARVTDITPTVVFLRDAQGKLRRLTLAVGR